MLFERGLGHTQGMVTGTVTHREGSLAWLRSALLLERAEASGSLRLKAHGRAAVIRLRGGAVTGFEGEVGPRIGHLLGHGREISSSRDASGASLLAAGLVSRNDLAWALRKQLRLRAREIARWGSVEASWEPGDVCVRPFTDPMALSDLVAEVLRAHAQDLVVSEPPSSGAITSTLGLYWASRAALFPHEIAAVRGVFETPAAARFEASLREAGLMDAPASQEELPLARLHAELRKRGAREILGGDADPESRRRALRRLAGLVHPDRFAHDPRLGSVSRELLVALATA